MSVSFFRSQAVRLGALVLLLAVAAVLVSAPDNPFSPRDKAFYADANTVNFVRPGLVIRILGAEIAADGTIRARVRITDPRGLPLDRLGNATPGAVALSFVAATIPAGQTLYTSYTVRTQTSPITRRSAIQAAADTGGTFTQTAEGEYTYTFGTRAPANINRQATHTIGVYGNRNLTEFDLGVNYDDEVFHFIPAGGTVTTVRDVIRTESCNKCHDKLAFHGGSRRSMELCVLCHTPQTVDPDTGNTVDMTVMTHKIHMGRELPSVRAGGKYQIIGFNQTVADYSEVVFPANIRRCEQCHEQGQGAARQATNYLTQPTREACGSCHDNVNFATGENHLNLPQVSDNQCATCHIPQGELELDASIKGAHVVRSCATNPPTAPCPAESSMVPGVVAEILKVDDGVAGRRPIVTFRVRDNSGAPIPLTAMQTTPNRVALVLAGPASDYGFTNFGADVTTAGYVSEDPTRTSTCGADGVCTYTFTRAIPANAKGTFSIGIEARRSTKLFEGTRKEWDAEYSAINRVFYFSVDGSPLAPRRKVVDIAKCNNCHGFLSLHGTNRNQIEQCVLCHNSGETDKARRPVATVVAERTRPPQAVQMAYMIHRIHTGEHLKAMGADYTVVGFGGATYDFTHVRYPAFAPNGTVGDLRNCDMCHVNNSEEVLPTGLADMVNPQGPINPMGAVTSACVGCHASLPAQSHAVSNTTRLGESCAACHRAGSRYAVGRVHAQ